MRQLPSLFFLFGDYWFEVAVKDYVMQVSERYCSFCLAYSNSNEWKLGTSFFKDWYVIHSIKEERMGFAPYNNESWRTTPEYINL